LRDSALRISLGKASVGEAPHGILARVHRSRDPQIKL
jgi:hypothetical protein